MHSFFSFLIQDDGLSFREFCDLIDAILMSGANAIDCDSNLYCTQQKDCTAADCGCNLYYNHLRGCQHRYINFQDNYVWKCQENTLFIHFFILPKSDLEAGIRT